jgi:hypothetical protein
LALSVMLKASAMQAVERITAFARCRCTALTPMGDASRARVYQFRVEFLPSIFAYIN